MIRAESLIMLGATAIIIGIVLLVVGSALQTSGKGNGTEDTSNVKTGGVVLIGPIPIIFGSDKGMTVTAVILAIILMIVSYLLFYRGSV